MLLRNRINKRTTKRVSRKKTFRLSYNDIKSVVSDAMISYMKDFQNDSVLEIEKLKKQQDEKFVAAIRNMKEEYESMANTLQATIELIEERASEVKDHIKSAKLGLNDIRVLINNLDKEFSKETEEVASDDKVTSDNNVEEVADNNDGTS